MSTFHFKQFSINQKQSAMKVGTDSILLGSWVNIATDVDSILDIGAGTGILALMSAQRSGAMTIDAVEIDETAHIEAVTNFENSPWADRLFCYHASLQNFAKEIDEKYDLIIANPPFFDPSKVENVSSRNVARQTHKLSHLSLLKNTKELLSKSGSCAFVIPYEIEIGFIDLAQKLGLFTQRILRVKDTEIAEYKRSLLQFSFEKSIVEIDELVLKKKDKNYSDAFIELTKDFYRDF